LSTRLNSMLDRIARLDEGLKQVSDNIAHDLKTPLTRLRNKADQALAVADVPGASREALQEVIADTDQIIKTFNALLMISRVESGSAAAELADLDLSALVRDVCELYEPVAEEAGFTFAVRIAPGLSMKGNRELLSQALSNLCDNALKYARPPEGGEARLEIAATRANGKVRLDVVDNGPGIPVGQREHVTERFTRLEESRTLPGNGLGLSLVQAVAQLHGGVLEFSDARGENGTGLTASLVLPVSGGKSS
ncbi:MAG: HAMP domain-containing sensor histidine kinase, partial [Pseudomonadota bacterium]|nr:HAMP domain-containing sensor histidine kinase [Pseudomonadota bacterium]